MLFHGIGAGNSACVFIDLHVCFAQGQVRRGFTGINRDQLAGEGMDTVSGLASLLLSAGVSLFRGAVPSARP